MCVISHVGMVETTKVLQAVLSFQLETLPNCPVKKQVRQHGLTWSTLSQRFLFSSVTQTFGNSNSMDIFWLPDLSVASQLIIAFLTPC